jgi:hypothetical protein
MQRFSRIDGDPVALEGDDWRARFSVAVREQLSGQNFADTFLSR